MTRILLVEDDIHQAKLIKTYVSKQFEAVDIVNQEDQIFPKLEENNYDVFILDVLLPYKNGIDICRELRQQGYNQPLLFISALNGQKDKIRAFQSGADDYLIKPFDLEELVCRIKALLKREHQQKKLESQQVLTWQKLRINTQQKEASYDNKSLNLTPTEFNLLEIMLTIPNQVFTTDTLIEKLWDLDMIPTRSTLRSHIKALRKKIQELGGEHDFIETVYGIGYRLKKLPERENNEEKYQSQLKTQQSSTGIKSSELNKNLDAENEKEFIQNLDQNLSPFKDNKPLEKALQELWQVSQTRIQKDCEYLENYIKRHEQYDHQTVIHLTHNLIGFLGSLKLTEASNICREIEDKLKSNTGDLNQEDFRLILINLINKLQLYLSIPPNFLNQDNCPKILENKLQNQNRVLLIEKDQHIINKLTELSKNSQIELDIANDLNSLQSKLKKNHYLCLIVENKIDGEILDFIDKNNPLNIPFIIYTEDDSLDNRINCIKYRSKAFVSKSTLPNKFWLDIQANFKKKNYLIDRTNDYYSILIIDDDTRFIQNLSNRLVNYNLPLKIDTLAEGYKFLDKIKIHPPDLILLDIMMPLMNGLDICRILKQDPLWQKIKTIIITAYLDKEIINRIVEVNVDDFISKSDIDLQLYPRIIKELKAIGII